MADPLPKYARVNQRNPEAWAQCDRCGFWYQSKDLAFQFEWAGTHLYNTGLLVCTTGNRCYDKPFEQLRTIIFPPDPPPILNARTPNLAVENTPATTNLSANVVQFATQLPVQGTSGFSVGSTIWVQLNNADFAQCQVTGVDATNNILSIQSPLPFSAPINGAITTSLTPD